MSKFDNKSGKKDLPPISTASLPDIIFMLLFFFMVTTVMRDTELKLNVTTPNATELTKLVKKSLVNYIYVGKPMERFKEKGNKPVMQLGDKFATEVDIPLFLEKHRQKIPENQRQGITTSLKIDRKVKMGLVSDIKTALRKSNQLKVNYSARRKAE